MTTFLTKKDIMSSNSSRPYYAIVQVKKLVYALAQVHPGQGYAPIMELEFTHKGAVDEVFHDVYQQLKAIYEGVSKHH